MVFPVLLTGVLSFPERWADDETASNGVSIGSDQGMDADFDSTSAPDNVIVLGDQSAPTSPTHPLSPLPRPAAAEDRDTSLQVTLDVRMSWAELKEAARQPVGSRQSFVASKPYRFAGHEWYGQNGRAVHVGCPLSQKCMGSVGVMFVRCAHNQGLLHRAHFA